MRNYLYFVDWEGRNTKGELEAKGSGAISRIKPIDTKKDIKSICELIIRKNLLPLNTIITIKKLIKAGASRPEEIKIENLK